MTQYSEFHEAVTRELLDAINEAVDRKFDYNSEEQSPADIAVVLVNVLQASIVELISMAVCADNGIRVELDDKVIADTSHACLKLATKKVTHAINENIATS